MSSLPAPPLIVHADWSLRAPKRWFARAVRQDGGYVLHAPERVGALTDFLRRLREMAGGPVLLGLDLPLGFPVSWAKRAGVARFLDVFPKLGRSAPWETFFQVAEKPEEISLYRPFYPRRPGGTRQKHLLDGLGLVSAAELRRACDMASNATASPCPMFWTMGANQVGKAMITAWRDALQPALADPGLRVALWPFDGPLAASVSRADVVVAEVYPGEVSGWVGVETRGGGKRAQSVRKRNGPRLEAALNHLPIRWTKEYQALLSDGFGPSADGEDAFDATIGLVGMVQVICGRQPLFEPTGPVLKDIEGWLLGRPAPKPADSDAHNS